MTSSLRWETVVWPIQDFLALGGPVLSVLMLVTFAMWLLIAERYWYFASAARRAPGDCAEASSARRRAVQRCRLSEYRIENERRLGLIRALVKGSLLLGLLGTVVGMIEVFDALAATGSSDARVIAAGVSKATLPTMAGLVAALSGFYCSTDLRRRERRLLERLEQRLA